MSTLRPTLRPAVISLGASDAAAIMGVSPYATPFQLWATVLGLIPPRKEEEPMTWGTRLEATVLDAFCAEQGLRVVTRSPATQRFSDARPWMRATPDAGVLPIAYDAPDALAEIKCVVGWPPEQPRLDWLIQVLWQQLVYEGVEVTYLVCFGNLRLDWWAVPRHQAALDAVAREADHFWKLVQTQTPPPLKPGDNRLVAKLWDVVKPAPVALPKSLVDVDAHRQYAIEQLTAWQKARDDAEVMIKAALADHAEGRLPNGITYTFRLGVDGRRPLRRKE